MSQVDLEQLAVEVGGALSTIPGLTVPAWGVERVTPPAAVIALPEEIVYDATYRRGTDHIEDLPVLILVSRTAVEASRSAIAGYAAGAGAMSVKAAVEAYEYTAADDVRVTSCRFDDVTYASVVYSAAIFRLEISGRGV